MADMMCSVNDVVNVHRKIIGGHLSELHLAVLVHDISQVRTLIEEGAVLEGTTAGGYTPLLTACYTGNVKIVELLISKNASVNAIDVSGKCALHIAVENNNLEVVEYLFEYLEDMGEAKPGDASFDLPLECAISSDNTKIVDCFLAHGADISIILEHAITYGALNVMKLLHSFHGENFENAYLFEVCEAGQLNMVKYMIEERNYLFNTVDDFSKRILYCAVKSCNIDLVRYLLDELMIDPRNIIHTTEHKFSLLHVAIVCKVESPEKRLPMVKYLVEERQFDVNDTDNTEKVSPLRLAHIYGNDYEIIEYLLEKAAKEFP